jgi:cephalosporin hydroxylase
MVRSVRVQASQTAFGLKGRNATEFVGSAAPDGTAGLTASCLHLYHKVLPESLIEVGSRPSQTGAMLRNIARTYGADAQFVTITPDLTEAKRCIMGQTLLKGDLMSLEEALNSVDVIDLPRPWIMSTNQASGYQRMMTTLHFALRHLQTGDFLVLEDQDVGGGQGLQSKDRNAGDALHDFLDANPGVLAKDGIDGGQLGPRSGHDTIYNLRRL